jgi:hypothetical protein
MHYKVFFYPVNSKQPSHPYEAQITYIKTDKFKEKEKEKNIEGIFTFPS